MKMAFQTMLISMLAAIALVMLSITLYINLTGIDIDHTVEAETIYQGTHRNILSYESYLSQFDYLKQEDRLFIIQPSSVVSEGTTIVPKTFALIKQASTILLFDESECMCGHLRLPSTTEIVRIPDGLIIRGALIQLHVEPDWSPVNFHLTLELPDSTVEQIIANLNLKKELNVLSVILDPSIVSRPDEFFLFDANCGTALMHCILARYNGIIYTYYESVDAPSGYMSGSFSLERHTKIEESLHVIKLTDVLGHKDNDFIDVSFAFDSFPQEQFQVSHTLKSYLARTTNDHVSPPNTNSRSSVSDLSNTPQRPTSGESPESNGSNGRTNSDSGHAARQLFA